MRHYTTKAIEALASKQWERPVVDEVWMEFPFPVSTNALWMRGKTGMIKTPRYATWFQAAGLELNRQKPGRIEGQFAADILVEQKDKRKRDVDNHVKGLLDLMQHHGVIEDDCLCQDLRIRWSSIAKGAWITLRSLKPVPLVRRIRQEAA